MKDPHEAGELWIASILNAFKDHFLSIVFVIVLFLLFWVVPQINDLIVVINQADNEWLVVLIFFSSLSVLAFLISTLDSFFNPPPLEEALPEEHKEPLSTRAPFFQAPKDAKELYLQHQKEQVLETRTTEEFHETQPEYIKRLFPKILGTVLILIATYAVNNTYQKVYESDIIIGGNWGLLVGIGLLILLLYKRWIDAISRWFRKYPWTSYLPIILALVCFLGILILGFFNEGGSQGDTERLFYSLMMLTVFFLLITTSYNKWVLKFKDLIGAKLILLLTIVSLIAYIILFFNPEALKSITPLPIVMICAIGIYSIFNLIRLTGRFLKIPLLLPLVLVFSVALAVYISNKANFTHFNASSVPTTIHPNQRMSLDTYIKTWIIDRKGDIRKYSAENKFPIILVSAEGGGSRAGLWSFLVQSYLYDRNPDYFGKFLFSMSGASGGGGGNNMFYTQAYHLQTQVTNVPFKFNSSHDGMHYRASAVYNKDFLSSSVASIMGRDLFKSITNIGDFRNRGALLENEWEAAFNAAFEYSSEQNPLAQPYLKIMPDSLSDYVAPILITNTTHLQSGERAIISPVSVAKDSHNLAVFMDLLGKYPNKSRMIKRSTAMSLNARFPFISPVARIDSLGQFGDAGYYDNIGGSVTRRLLKALVANLEQEAAKDSTIRDKYEIKQLLITNHEKSWKADGVKYSSQLTGPASIIWNATFAHPTEMEKTFTDAINIESRRTPIDENKAILSFTADTLKRGQMIPFIPLGRYLSKPAVLSLEKRLEMVEQHLNGLIPKSED